jgi:hypothetical protein
MTVAKNFHNVQLLYHLEPYMSPLATPARMHLRGVTWATTSSLLLSGFIVGAVRCVDVSDGFTDWDSIWEYRYFDTENCEACTFHALITKRGMEALYRGRRIKFDQAIDAWERREQARAAWTVDHPNEFLVVANPDDLAGNEPDPFAEENWALECLP